MGRARAGSVRLRYQNTFHFDPGEPLGGRYPSHTVWNTVRHLQGRVKGKGNEPLSLSLSDHPLPLPFTLILYPLPTLTWVRVKSHCGMDHGT